MKFLIVGLLLCYLLYFGFKFIQLLMKMKQTPLLHINYETDAGIRKLTNEAVKPPNYSEQKFGIILYCVSLGLVLWLLVIELFTKDVNWFPAIIVILPLMPTFHLFNQFVVVEDGIISGSWFIAWKRVKSYRFSQIDTNDFAYYHIKKELSDAYELKIQMKVFYTKCIVTTPEMKERIAEMLDHKIAGN